MTDADLVAKKLAEIESRVQELRSLADLDRLRSDLKEERFVTHTLQLAVQAALDVASHIVADDRLGEPQTNQDLFTLLERHGWLDPGLAERLRDMARFRNLLVHGYAGVNLDLVADIVRHDLRSSSPRSTEKSATMMRNEEAAHLHHWTSCGV